MTVSGKSFFARNLTRTLSGLLPGWYLLVRLAAARVVCAMLTVAATVHCGGPLRNHAGGDAEASDASNGSGPLPTGAVAVTGALGACGAGALPGATCRSINVSCPGVPDITATIAVALPTSGQPAGTVVVHDGRGGTTFFSDPLASDYLSDGYRVVQIQWDSDWEQTPGGIPGVLAAACRPATVYRWAYRDVHHSSTASGYCLFGFSGGSGAVAYAMSHYGLGGEADHAQLAAGPPFGRLDYGCNPAAAPAPTETLSCAVVPSSPFAYYGPYLAFVQMIEGAPTCGEGSPTASEMQRWHNDSVVSDGATYSYEKTDLSFWACGSMPQIANGLGGFYWDQVTSTKSMHCYSGGCSGEAPYSDPIALADMRADLRTGCVPRHL